ncbi:unnamed protein product [Anisakis simplex]|uniref:EF-hand domain-containing protein n=1 Tax=Anisakis simplex TaxID=6269 RepID=A0A0M3K1C5_ANISI|nr:unnamed protein product [Anisakis simplex]
MLASLDHRIRTDNNRRIDMNATKIQSTSNEQDLSSLPSSNHFLFFFARSSSSADGHITQEEAVARLGDQFEQVKMVA